MQPSISHSNTPQGLRVQVKGAWQLATLMSLKLPALPEERGAVTLDGEQIRYLDTSGAWALLRFLLKEKIDLDTLQCVNFSKNHQAIFDLVKSHIARETVESNPSKPSSLLRLGLWAEQFGGYIKGMLQFIGALSLESLQLLASPSRFRVKEFTNQLEEVLIYAVPLAFSMMFLLGLVFSYLLGLQAKQYGANIFVVDGSTLALCRELAPVIVAILVAGRSGAAMTAQLGTMKVYEEIDAISVLGLSPMAVLVIPRILALLIALPLLVFVGDVSGILGSMLVAAQQLDITPVVYMNRLTEVFEVKTLVIGLLKAPVFAMFIAIIACYMGLNVAKDARSIGLNTTSTVVQSIVAVILINAVIAITLVELGI